MQPVLQWQKKGGFICILVLMGLFAWIVRIMGKSGDGPICDAVIGEDRDRRS